jgi:oxygen-independent coproporphyrinogen-3 oxidase
MITNDYERIKNYLDFLFLEIDLFCKFFEENSIIPNFTEIHIGGGSPTILQEKEFGQLLEKLQLIVDLKNLSEFSIEIDPREVNIEKIKFYHTKGIDRISFGIQDFDPDVQKAINRVQPPELVEKLLTPEVRKRFEKGINFDIICGLPLQSQESIRRTFERIVKISPDRICFNYLHYSPKFYKHQMIMIDARNGRPTKLPDVYERKMIFTEALNILLKNGYVRTGYDHFAKPDDEVAKAMKNKTMHWNALGVTSGRYSDVIGIGPHSWSTIGNYYSQNVYELPLYEAAVTKGRFPIYRGYKLNKDDIIRREVIQALRNFFFLDFNDVEKKYNIDFKKYFKEEIVSLAEFIKDGIAELSDKAITITELGQQFTNIVCMNFDSYIKKG